MRLYNPRAAAAVAVSVLFAGGKADLDSLVIKGNKFFYANNGTQFFIKGIAYQQLLSSTSLDPSQYIDPLADGPGCLRDIPYMQDLGLNAVRTYAIDTTSDHDDCMNAFADADIYVFVDLWAPPAGEDFNVSNPAWNQKLYDRFTSVIDVMHGYSNMIGFFVADQVIETAEDTPLAPYIKAAVRDMKKYITDQNYRNIPVGYSMNQYPGLSEDLADYMNCGDPSDAVDFLGLFVNTWCGDSTYTVSGYSGITDQYESFSVPVFFSRYGCNTPSPRNFDDVQALYSSLMDGVFSGGIVYEYFQERNNYGLVEVDGTSVSTLQDYKNFKSQLAQVTPTGVQSANFVSSDTPASCPSAGPSWSASAGALPTAPVAAAVDNGGGSDPNSSGNGDSSTTGNPNPGPVSPSSSGLSSGATIGIGVGVGLGAALVLAIGGFLFWRWKRSKKPWPESQNEKNGGEGDPAVMLHGESRAHELAQPESEMPVGRETLEMEAGHGKSEMGRRTSSAVGRTGVEGRHELAGS